MLVHIYTEGRFKCMCMQVLGASGFVFLLRAIQKIIAHLELARVRSVMQNFLFRGVFFSRHFL